MLNKTIDSLHREKTGKVSDKWASYLVYYDELFESLRDQPLSLLEIGVQNGGSLETWASYFSHAKHIVGCDIDKNCGLLEYNDPRVKIIVGNANEAFAFQSIRAISSTFDIVIDDGSHLSLDILNSFVNYFPLLKPGGIYVIEDSHTLYNDAFGGGILNDFSAYSFFKKLIDVVNFQFWKDELSIQAYLRTFFPLKTTPGFILEGWVDSVSFQNSIITIKKAQQPGHTKLGERVLVGNFAQVQTWGGTFKNTDVKRPDQASAQPAVQKRIIQTYKASQQWVNGPPGLGDFVRGISHLIEKLEGTNIELRVDVSQTDFANLIEQDSSVFQIGEESDIAFAEEYFVDHRALHDRIIAFQNSEDSKLYISTNIGAWNRTSLPKVSREFSSKIYQFNPNIESQVANALQTADYEVLSIRCGDGFYTDGQANVSQEVKSRIHNLIEKEILPHAQYPLVITSDCHPLKIELSKKYGFMMLPHRSQHGAFGNALPVAMDLCLLKKSKFIHHINCWANWWSGFSHYTAIIFQIPSVNFRAPNFLREEITAGGQLVSTTNE
jgi:hypothetical protein